MAVRKGLYQLLNNFSRTIQISIPISTRYKATAAYLEARRDVSPSITSAVPGHHMTAKVMFHDHLTADFKYIWLRDNCNCPQCLDVNTKQKLVDTPSLDIGIKPISLVVNPNGRMTVVWPTLEGTHTSEYSSEWLYKYGKIFLHNAFESECADHENVSLRPEMKLWNRTDIWAEFPELSYNEFLESEDGLRRWLDIFYTFGVALLRGVPIEKDKIVDVVKRFAYVKETQYGHTFDVINMPAKGSHLAYSGLYLAHHTDMNYREKSPGMQLLHCLRANDPKKTGEDPGGQSFFADGFRAAKWMEENEPAAFHVLTSTPVRFSIHNEGMSYSAVWPVICVNSEGNIMEIHLNNRTMKPLQAPTHIVTPFYHAYKIFTDRINDPSVNLEFHMLPGDLVAFNNRRVLHGRTGYDASKVDRHLQGCYVDIDEAFSKYDQLLAK